MSWELFEFVLSFSCEFIFSTFSKENAAREKFILSERLCFLDVAENGKALGNDDETDDNDDDNVRDDDRKLWDNDGDDDENDHFACCISGTVKIGML